MKISKSTFWKIIITILAILFIIWYFVKNPLEIDAIVAKGDQINWEYFWFGTFLFLLSNFLDGLAWHKILNFLDRRIKTVDSVIANFVGFCVGIFIPVASVSELATKTLMIQKKYPEFTSEEVVSSIAAIRTVFLITAYGSWGFLIISLGYEGLIDIYFTLILLVVVWIGITILIYFVIQIFGNADKLNSAFSYLQKKSSEKSRLHGIFEAIKTWFVNFSKTFNEIKLMPRKEIIVMMILVFSQNFIKWISVYFIFKAVLDLPFFVVMVVSVVIGFVNLIPAGIPGLAGLREIATFEGVDIVVGNSIISWLASLIQSLSLYLVFVLAFLVGLPYWLLAKPVNEERETRAIDSDSNSNEKD